jgi:acyl-CoA thioesterase I
LTPGAVARSTDTLVQFEDPTALIEPAGLPGTLEEEAAAGLYGISVAELRGLRRGFANGVDAAAGELLADPGFAARVDALPFAGGDLIVAVGDSLTADLQSWARVLAGLLTRRSHATRIVNRGVSSDISTGVVARIEPILRARPDWIIALVGTNDARRHGDPDAPMIVSDSETAANLDKLAALTASRTEAQLTWITPPPMIAELVERDPGFRDDAVWWRAEDLAAKARLVRERSETVVDLDPVLSGSPREPWFLDDGLHLSLAGQTRVAKALVETLARP